MFQNLCVSNTAHHCTSLFHPFSAIAKHHWLCFQILKHTSRTYRIAVLPWNYGVGPQQSGMNTSIRQVVREPLFGWHSVGGVYCCMWCKDPWDDENFASLCIVAIDSWGPILQLSEFEVGLWATATDKEMVNDPDEQVRLALAAARQKWKKTLVESANQGLTLWNWFLIFLFLCPL
jgi:hypothetical protein